MRVVTFLSTIHCLRYSSAFSPFSQSNRKSSKPSSFCGKQNFVKDVLMMYADKSGMALFLNGAFFSSGVSSTSGGGPSISSSASSFSSSSGSSSSIGAASSGTYSSPFSSASFFFFSSSIFLFLSSSAFFFSFSAFFLCFSRSFCRFSIIFFLFSSAFLARNSASDASFLAFSMRCCEYFLNSAGGSEDSKIRAILENCGKSLKGASSCALSSGRRALFTSMTM
mmetsp:Transcript_67010/g.160593  ORF Transcript_67010/g.160593 Transcript_67010/m.160593 type:complete len:224 (-) Transcript_67010:1108-1779(-)